MHKDAAGQRGLHWQKHDESYKKSLEAQATREMEDSERVRHRVDRAQETDEDELDDDER